MNSTENQILIKGGVVVTMDDNMTVYEDGAVLTENNRIVAVGPTRDVASQAGEGAKIIDGSGKITIPGLTNLHFHTSIGKGYFGDMDLEKYLNSFWYPYIRNIEPEDAYWAAMCSYSEALRSGTTAVNDMWRQMAACGDAAEKIGIRATLCCDVALPEEQLDTLSDNEALYIAKNGAAGGRIEVAFGLEWMPLANIDLLYELRAMADKHKAKIHIHLNESIDEVEVSRRMFGASPATLAYETGVLGPDCIGAHCVWLTDREIDMFAERGASISHNPASNAKLGNGIARLPELLNAGVCVGIGHDDAGCNNSVDLFDTMRYASLLHKGIRRDSFIITPEQVLTMATRNGAKALSHDAGQLSPGKLADITLLERDNEHFSSLLFLDDGRTNIYPLLSSADGADVDTVIVDGAAAVLNRTLTNADSEEVYAKADEAFFRVGKKIGLL